jgi:hypothetical protein
MSLPRGAYDYKIELNSFLFYVVSLDESLLSVF